MVENEEESLNAEEAFDQWFDHESVENTELSDDDVKVAARLQNIMEAKTPNGEYRYTNEEVRGFMCAMIFEVGIPMTAELEAVVYRFFEDVDLPQEDPTPEEMLTALRSHFDKHPLNPQLAAEVAQFGRDELQRSKEGFNSNDRVKQNAARISAGFQATPTRAPEDETTKPRAAPPKVKRGLR